MTTTTEQPQPPAPPVDPFAGVTVRTIKPAQRADIWVLHTWLRAALSSGRPRRES